MSIRDIVSVVVIVALSIVLGRATKQLPPVGLGFVQVEAKADTSHVAQPAVKVEAGKASVKPRFKPLVDSLDFTPQYSIPTLDTAMGCDTFHVEYHQWDSTFSLILLPCPAAKYVDSIVVTRHDTLPPVVTHEGGGLWHDIKTGFVGAAIGITAYEILKPREK